ncbi:MAG: alpha/beta hydrolase, partial [Planctomycetota bacterium]
IHGGGWQVNTKEWFTPHAVYLARAGFVTATINYRKRPEHTVQNCLEDAKAAIAWVRAHANELGIDPRRIGALGGSAGGHLVAVLAVTPDETHQVNAAVGFAAADLGHPDLEPFYEDLELSEEEARALGAYPHVTASAAPLLLVHGTEDDTVPVGVSKDLHQRFQERGATSELKLLDGYHHVFYVTPKTFFESMGYAEHFFREHLEEPN